MAKKEEQPKENKLTIERAFGYKIIISKDGYEVSWDKTNENNLAAMAICNQIFNDLIGGVKTLHVSTHQEKVAKRDRLDRLRKLNLEVVDSMAEVAEYLLENKTQADYDAPKKSKIKEVPIEEVKKIILPK